jgi:uncharacterized protein YciI
MSEATAVGSSRERASLFLFRLIPPRPDFAQTMTPEEQHAMAGHMEYWQRLLHDGLVVVYGPVADPEGMWGLGVLRATDRADVLAIGARDPSVSAGVNTFEVFEIVGGITP